jgi:hypothetical protein
MRRFNKSSARRRKLDLVGPSLDEGGVSQAGGNRKGVQMGEIGRDLRKDQAAQPVIGLAEGVVVRWLVG